MAIALLLVSIQPASAQHVTTWAKRQVQGVGRHVALRHHKPGHHKKAKHHSKHKKHAVKHS
jgi:hypothetical protein